MGNINGININGTNINGTNINGTDINGTNINGTDINGTNINGTNINGTNINGTNINGANINGTNISETAANRISDVSKADTLDPYLVESCTYGVKDRVCPRLKLPVVFSVKCCFYARVQGVYGASPVAA